MDLLSRKTKLYRVSVDQNEYAGPRVYTALCLAAYRMRGYATIRAGNMRPRQSNVVISISSCLPDRDVNKIRNRGKELDITVSVEEV